MSILAALAKLVLVLAAGSEVLALPTTRSQQLVTRTTNPTVSESNLAAISLDPNYQRDSCVSATSLINGRVLWVCRDTQVLVDESIDDEFNGQAGDFVSSSASWSDQLGTQPHLVPIPSNQGQQQATSGYPAQLTMYGGDTTSTSFLPYASDECDQNGNQAGTGGTCASDGTRYPLWIDSPPYVYQGSDGSATAYVYMMRTHIQGLTNLASTFPTSLYQINYDSSSSSNSLPSVELINEYWFPDGVFNYGDFGGITGTLDGKLYLYGQGLSKSNNGHQPVALARCSNPTDLSTYEYYYNDGTWSTTQAQVDDQSAWLDGEFGKGGTFFYSDYTNSYLWIGQPTGAIGATVMVSSASSPEGPWSTPTQIANLPSGDSYAYSVAAHPEMSSNSQQIYLTYTLQKFYDGNSNDIYYEQPLYMFTWD
ncbi:hypothetical protein BD324DRAFT_647500 [Kockovaella imperatae]|uniref:DUF4185 domain-containing protein n=1 Tax=Kockovaella imperatae TaxID=4999 RepID=A0A1Y1UTQ7_9TREE|nr:hypothetical protein BD324DRAFT_647500 [Kockovaella imperatae]ORX40575.1 hypothetical protein BD324DRAFT_647500 [Kockovaella imperatae]